MTKKQKQRKNTLDIAQLACSIISEKKGQNIVAFDVTGLSSFTDYVIIASGMNAPHLKALLNETLVRLKQNGHTCYRKSGEPDSGWIIVDYLDVMIHFFTREQREYYDLDGLLKNAPKTPVQIE